MVQFNVSVTTDIDKNTDLHEQAAKILAEEIDWELMCDMMVAVGWTKVELARFKDRHHSIDIKLWLDENCCGHYKNRGSTFMFQKAEEAEWFSLRWL